MSVPYFCYSTAEAKNERGKESTGWIRKNLYGDGHGKANFWANGLRFVNVKYRTIGHEGRGFSTRNCISNKEEEEREKKKTRYEF